MRSRPPGEMRSGRRGARLPRTLAFAPPLLPCKPASPLPMPPLKLLPPPAKALAAQWADGASLPGRSRVSSRRKVPDVTRPPGRALPPVPFRWDPPALLPAMFRRAPDTEPQPASWTQVAEVAEREGCSDLERRSAASRTAAAAAAELTLTLTRGTAGLTPTAASSSKVSGSGAASGASGSSTSAGDICSADSTCLWHFRAATADGPGRRGWSCRQGRTGTAHELAQPESAWQGSHLSKEVRVPLQQRLLALGFWLCTGVCCCHGSGGRHACGHISTTSEAVTCRKPSPLPATQREGPKASQEAQTQQRWRPAGRCLAITQNRERPAADFRDAPHAPRSHCRHDLDVFHD